MSLPSVAKIDHKKGRHVLGNYISILEHAVKRDYCVFCCGDVCRSAAAVMVDTVSPEVINSNDDTCVQNATAVHLSVFRPVQYTDISITTTYFCAVLVLLASERCQFRSDSNFEG